MAPFVLGNKDTVIPDVTRTSGAVRLLAASSGGGKCWRCLETIRAEVCAQGPGSLFGFWAECEQPVPTLSVGLAPVTVQELWLCPALGRAEFLQQGQLTCWFCTSSS